MKISEQLTYKKIFLFWSPLALTWLMMAAEQPFLVSVIARLPDAKHNLAAFGIAFSFALIVEAPVIMLMSASTALVTDRNSFKKLKRFTDILNLSVVIVQLLVLIPPVFNFIVRDLMGVPENVAHLTYISLILLILWPPAIGYRRFYQGILIRNNLTRRVTYGTIVRLLVIALAGFILYLAGIPGAYVGGATLSIAVFAEAVASWLMARKTVKRIISEGDHDENNNPGENPEIKLGYRFITRFYTPLALTSLLSLGVHPFVTFFLGRSQMPIESLAVLPVVNSLVFIFRSVGLSYQEVNIALIGDRKQNYGKLRNFAVILGSGVTVLLGIIAFTPLAVIWFRDVSGLTADLADLAYFPLKLLLILPALSVLLSFQRSILVAANNTRPISIATAVELVVILLVLLVCVGYLNMVGVIAASLAYIIGKSASNIYLVPRLGRTVRRWKSMQG
ncbi:MAG: MATE family efflux transporter [Bacteroidales bacterium]|nr:MATE family efflux transporter [Bacteroidales bacterium]